MDFEEAAGPPINEERCGPVADAAPDVIARLGTAGLSHRSVDEAAAVPNGTTSNYFRTRAALLEAAVRRVVGLHFRWITAARAEVDGPSTPTASPRSWAPSASRPPPCAAPGTSRCSSRPWRAPGAPSWARSSPMFFRSAVGVLTDAHRGVDPSPLELRMVAMFYNGAVFTSLVVPQLLGGLEPGDITRAMLRLVLADNAR